MNKLTPYEHHEIFNYPQIYFIGANAKKRPGIIGGPNNCGYDDDQVEENNLVMFIYSLTEVWGQRIRIYERNAVFYLVLGVNCSESPPLKSVALGLSIHVGTGT